MARLAVYPWMSAALRALPPKMYALSSHDPPLPIVRDDVVASEEQVAKTIDRIGNAHFIGRGDREMVSRLFKDYISNLASVLQTLLGRLRPRAQVREKRDLPVIEVPVLEQSAISLMPSQLVLVRGFVAGWRFGIVDTDELVQLPLNAADDVTLSFDSCNQTVLPWRQLEKSELDALANHVRALGGAVESARRRSESLRAETVTGDGVSAIAQEVEALSTLKEHTAVKAMTSAATALVAAIADVSSKQKGVEEAAEQEKKAQAGELWMLLRDAPEAAEKEKARLAAAKTKAATALQHAKTKVPEQLRGFQKAVAGLKPEGFEEYVVAKLLMSGECGVRRYAQGQWLTVRTPQGKWEDVQVGEDGAVRLKDGQDIALNRGTTHRGSCHMSSSRRCMCGGRRKWKHGIISSSTRSREDSSQRWTSALPSTSWVMLCFRALTHSA